MNESLPKALQTIQDKDPGIRLNALHWLMQSTIEKRRKKQGALVDTVRRYRYHLFPETAMQIIRFLYGEKVARRCERFDWGENAQTTRDAEESNPMMEDRWEEHYRKIDSAFVAQEYSVYPKNTIEAIMNISLFCLRAGELGPERRKVLQEAIETLEMLPGGDFSIDNLIAIGKEKLNQNPKNNENKETIDCQVSS